MKRPTFRFKIQLFDGDKKLIIRLFFAFFVYIILLIVWFDSGLRNQDIVQVLISLFGFASLIYAFITYHLFMFNVKKQKLLNEFGKCATAIVSEKIISEIEIVKINKKFKKFDYELEYTFQYQNKTYKKSLNVSKSLFDKYTLGGEIPIKFQSTNPKNSEIQ